MSFSYFKNGITDLVPTSTFEFDKLVEIILNNPNDNIIKRIRDLRLKGDNLYKKFKSEQQYITPHSIVNFRKLEGHYFESNFIDFSGFIFYDLDYKNELEEVDNYKDYIINKYGHVASLVCKSISGGGVTICFKIKNRITSKNEFDSAISYITTNILNEEIEYIDDSMYRIGQAIHITSDPYAFVDFNNEIEVDLKYPSIIEKSIKQYIMGNYINNTPIDTFFDLSLKQLLKKIKIVTDVQVSNRIVDLKRVEVAKIHYRKKKIIDTQKHQVYTAIIHTLAYINPDVHPAYLFAYLYHYNLIMADPPMVYEKLENHFRFVYNSILADKENDNYRFSKIKVKWVHTNKLSGISADTRNSIANKLNGKRRSNSSIEKIVETKNEMISEGIKVTQKSVADRSGLSIATVKRYYKEKTVDLEKYVKELNKHNGFDVNKSNKLENEYYIHPECPSWVLRQEDSRIR